LQRLQKQQKCDIQKPDKARKNSESGVAKMYRKAEKQQITFEEYQLPFSGSLSAENRWVKMATLIPWDMVEDEYAKSFKNEVSDGRPPIPARMAFGALHIKEHEQLTDERVVENAAENPYMQYFLGMKEFRQEKPFDPSMMVYFRKRFSTEAIQRINDELYRRIHPRQEPPEDGGDAVSSGEEEAAAAEPKEQNAGTLILDATVAPADIRFPMDLSLLNECRENTERMIDDIWEHTARVGHKTAYSRKKARAAYLKVVKQRKPRRNAVRQAVGEQLGYVEKNLVTLDRLLKEAPEGALSEKRLARLAVIRKVAAQQRVMWDTRTQSCEERILSLRQPHVRSVYRGKAGRAWEYGQKLALSVVDGFTFIEKQSWEPFNEGSTLQDSAQAYRKRHGVYPEAILADTIYRTRANRRFCKSKGIRLSGPRLGRPKAEELEADREQAYRDSCERSAIEGRNGVAKRRFGMDLIMAYLDCSAMTEAAMTIFAMNLAHAMRALLRRVFYEVFDLMLPLICVNFAVLQ
jgi:hypothetical protein